MIEKQERNIRRDGALFLLGLASLILRIPATQTRPSEGTISLQASELRLPAAALVSDCSPTKQICIHR
ncbi:hypothetical protein C8039_07240 [Halogeometricum sp. wsp3]|nr:hypothetical protein C8039_07240 [Halogeometricum sp. wsp3]